MRHRSQESRRKSSIDRINLELEDFKEEIARRFKRSKFNHTYTFPRLDDSECRSNKQHAKVGMNSKARGNQVSFNQFYIENSVNKSKNSTTNKESK